MQENSAYGTDIAVAPEIATEQNVAYGHTGMSGYEKTFSTNSDAISRQLLQQFDTNEIRRGNPINEDDLGSATDATSTTTYNTVFPYPIAMNLPGTRVETLV